MAVAENIAGIGQPGVALSIVRVDVQGAIRGSIE